MQTKTISTLAIISSFALLILGAIVHHYTSAIDCSTWPLCYTDQGHVSAIFNNAHRYLGMLVGLFTVGLLWKTRSYTGRISKAGVFSFVFLLIQGIMGAVTALYQLPTVVSTFHFILSIIFLFSLMYIRHHLKDPLIRESGKAMKWDPKVTDRISASLFIFFVSTILGAFVRHSDIMGSCGLGLDSVFMCFGDFWPSGAQPQVHMFYRYLTVIAWSLAHYSFWSCLSQMRKTKNVVKGFALCFFAINVSFALGLLSIWQYLDSLYSSLHTISQFFSLLCFWNLYLNVDAIEERDWGRRKFSYLRDIISLAKPRLASLVMMTSLVGILLAPASINFFKALTGFLAIFLVVAGGCALNCLMEIKVDALMERTKERPLPAGRMSSVTALVFGITTSVIGLGSLYFFVNTLTASLALTASVLYLFAYTPLKQKSVIALYIGAVPGAIPPVMGWTMVMGSMDIMAWFLFAILFVWQLPHFMAISIYLAQDYGSAKIQVYPNEFGLLMTRWAILLLTVILAIVSYYPVWSELQSSMGYQVSCFVLNSLFILSSLKLLLLPYKNEKEIKYWAKFYFFCSIIYLPLILLALIFLK